MAGDLKKDGGGCWQKAGFVLALLSVAASVALLVMFLTTKGELPRRMEQQEATLREQEALIRELHGKLEFHKMHLHRVQKEMQVIFSKLKSNAAREDSLRRRQEATKIFSGEPSGPAPDPYATALDSDKVTQRVT